MIIEVNEENFNESIQNAGTSYLIVFYTDWCKDSEKIISLLEKKKDLNVLKINLEENENIMKDMEILKTPSLVLIKDGEIEHKLDKKEDLTSQKITEILQL